MQKTGQVLKSNGADGELLLSFTGVAPEDIDLEEPVFIFFDGLPVPFYFESFKKRGNSRALARLTGIHNLKDAQEVSGQPFWTDYFEDEEETSLEGWTLEDAEGNTVGTVSDYEPIPGNLCLWVETPRGTVLVPFNEDLIIKADRNRKLLKLHIPDGLLDL